MLEILFPEQGDKENVPAKYCEALLNTLTWGPMHVRVLRSMLKKLSVRTIKAIKGTRHTRRLARAMIDKLKFAFYRYLGLPRRIRNILVRPVFKLKSAYEGVMALQKQEDLRTVIYNKYPKITLDDNPKITQAEYERACQIGKIIQGIISMQNSYVRDKKIEASLAQPSEIWKDTKGLPVYGSLIRGNVLEPSYDMVNHFRLYVSQFTGYNVANIIGEEVTPSWTDNIAGEINPELAVSAPDWSVSAFLETVQNLPPDLVCKPLLKLGEVGWLVNGSVVNRDVMAYQERVALLYQHGIIEELRKRERVKIIEIGGGYGGLAYFIKQILANANYFICDLPMSLFYSGVYLSLVNDFDDNLIYTGRNKEELFDDRSGFIFVPNFLFSDLESTKFDLAINTLSFAEMEPSIVESYVRSLASMLKDSGFYLNKILIIAIFGYLLFVTLKESFLDISKLKRPLVSRGDGDLHACGQTIITYLLKQSPSWIIGLLQSEWVELSGWSHEVDSEQGFREVSRVRKCGMIRGCEHGDDLITHTASLGFVQGPWFGKSSVIRRRGFSDSIAVGKNHLRCLRPSASDVLRSRGALDTGPALWGHLPLSGGDSPAWVLSNLQEGEAGEVGL